MNRIVIISVVAMACAGCAGSDGNPNGMPYAGQPGGTIAVTPQDTGMVMYNPDAPNPSSDSRMVAPVLGSDGGMPVRSPSTGPYAPPPTRPH